MEELEITEEMITETNNIMTSIGELIVNENS